MGNKHSANISDPRIRSYTQHPYGYPNGPPDNGYPTGPSTMPRRSSFSNGSPGDFPERPKLALSKSTAFEECNGSKTLQLDQVRRRHKGDESSRPGTNDSGYFTGYMTDSDKSQRARLHGSRASLNESMFVGSPPPQFLRIPPPPGTMGPMGPPAPGAMGQPHMWGPPPFGMSPMGMYPPHLAPVESKKAKKWRKKQQKLISRHESMMSNLESDRNPMLPPYALMGPPPPGAFHPMGYRAQSMDNLHIAARTPQMLGPPPPGHMAPGPRRFTSQLDLRMSNNGPMPHLQPMYNLQALPPLEGKYDKKGKKLKEVKKETNGSLKGSLLGYKKSHSSAPSSKSGRTSRQESTSNTKFEEERILKPSDTLLRMQMSNEDRDNSDSFRSPPPDVIYETLKAARRSTLLTTADVEFEKNRETKENVLNISFERPTFDNDNRNSKNECQSTKNERQPQPIISPEARIVMERNAELLENAEKHKTSIQHFDYCASKNDKETATVSQEPMKTAQEPMKVFQEIRVAQEARNVAQEISKLVQETPKIAQHEPSGSVERDESKPPEAKVVEKIKEVESSKKIPAETLPMVADQQRRKSTSSEDSLIEAVHNPCLIRRKVAKPKDFEPLDAWREIVVQPGTSRTVDVPEQYLVKENISVRLVAAPPGRSDSNEEPIYLEYDERLPEFKKRLIETGSFDFAEVEKFHHSSQYSGSKVNKDVESTNELDQRSSVAKDEQRRIDMGRKQLANNDGKGSLKRLKESVATMFGGSKSNERLNDPTLDTLVRNQNHNERSMTPTTAKIKAGDSSDIDFSWVYDLETRFRRERAQFERELESRKQKTLTRNGTQLSEQFCLPNDFLTPSATLLRQSNGHHTNGGHLGSNGHSESNGPNAQRCQSSEANGESNQHEHPKQVSSNNVRNKAALFESEAQRLQLEMDAKNHQLFKQKQQQARTANVVPSHSRSHSIEDATEEPIYIPKPDYELPAPPPMVVDDRPSSRYVKNQRPTSRNNARRDYSPANELEHVGCQQRSGYEQSNHFVERSNHFVDNQQISHEVGPVSPGQRRLNRFYTSNGFNSSKVDDLPLISNGGNQEVHSNGFGTHQVHCNAFGTHQGRGNGFGNHQVQCNGFATHQVQGNGFGAHHDDGFGKQYTSSYNDPSWTSNGKFTHPNEMRGDSRRDFIPTTTPSSNRLNGYSRMNGYANEISAPYASQPSFDVERRPIGRVPNGHSMPNGHLTSYERFAHV